MKVMNFVVYVMAAALVAGDINAQEGVRQRERTVAHEAGSRPCPWVKLRTSIGETNLYGAESGSVSLGLVPRSANGGGEIYLQKLATLHSRLQVLVVGNTPLNGTLGWVEQDKVEAATERCCGFSSSN